MIVVVSTSDVRLVEAVDLRKFHVAAPADLSEEALSRLLLQSGAGALESAAEAMIRVDWLRASATGTDESWSKGFDDMLTFAASKGWMSRDGQAVKAHIVRSSSAT